MFQEGIVQDGNYKILDYCMDSKNNYPLQIASKYMKFNMAQYLIKNGIEKDINHQNKRGQSAYHYAAQSGQLTIMKLLEQQDNHDPHALTK